MRRPGWPTVFFNPGWIGLSVNGGGKVDHMGGSIVGLRLSLNHDTQWYVLPPPLTKDSLQHIGGADLSVRRAGVLRLIDTQCGSPNGRYVNQNGRL